MDYDKLIEDLKTYKIREEQPLVCKKPFLPSKRFVPKAISSAPTSPA